MVNLEPRVVFRPSSSQTIAHASVLAKVVCFSAELDMTVAKVHEIHQDRTYVAPRRLISSGMFTLTQHRGERSTFWHADLADLGRVKSAREPAHIILHPPGTPTNSLLEDLCCIVAVYAIRCAPDRIMRSRRATYARSRLLCWKSLEIQNVAPFDPCATAIAVVVAPPEDESHSRQMSSTNICHSFLLGGVSTRGKSRSPDLARRFVSECNRLCKYNPS